MKFTVSCISFINIHIYNLLSLPWYAPRQEDNEIKIDFSATRHEVGSSFYAAITNLY
jgi:hypothetical protein